MPDIPFDKIVAAMLTTANWARDSMNPDSDGGVAITLSEGLGLVKDIITSMGFNPNIYDPGRPE